MKDSNNTWLISFLQIFCKKWNFCKNNINQFTWSQIQLGNCKWETKTVEAFFAYECERDDLQFTFYLPEDYCFDFVVVAQPKTSLKVLILGMSMKKNQSTMTTFSFCSFSPLSQLLDKADPTKFAGFQSFWTYFKDDDSVRWCRNIFCSIALKPLHFFVVDVVDFCFVFWKTWCVWGGLSHFFNSSLFTFLGEMFHKAKTKVV